MKNPLQVSDLYSVNSSLRFFSSTVVFPVDFTTVGTNLAIIMEVYNKVPTAQVSKFTDILPQDNDEGFFELSSQRLQSFTKWPLVHDYLEKNTSSKTNLFKLSLVGILPTTPVTAEPSKHRETALQLIEELFTTSFSMSSADTEAMQTTLQHSATFAIFVSRGGGLYQEQKNFQCNERTVSSI